MLKSRNSVIVLIALFGMICLVGVAVWSFLSLDSILNVVAKANFAWQCASEKEKTLTRSGLVKWVQVNCQGEYPMSLYLFHKTRNTGNLKVNIVDADLTDHQIYLTPVLADTNDEKNPYKETLLSMGDRNQKFIAGINGGYFFENRLNKPDANCLYKHYPELTPVGIGDGLLIIKNKTYSYNCVSKINPLRSSFVEDGYGNWRIMKVDQGYGAHFANALGAGPGLIDNKKGKERMALSWEGISSTFEFSANTAVILAIDNNHHSHVIFFTVDGVDKKKGMYSMEMANFIYYEVPLLLNVKINSAMSMDQGGSTTMYIRNNSTKIVSSSSINGGVRPIYNALFIAEK